MSTIDVTELVDFDNPDDEYLPIIKCVCGKEFRAWNFIISIYDDTPKSCPHCERKFYFRNRVRVYQVIDS